MNFVNNSSTIIDNNFASALPTPEDANAGDTRASSTSSDGLSPLCRDYVLSPARLSSGGARKRLLLSKTIKRDGPCGAKCARLRRMGMLPTPRPPSGASLIRGGASGSKPVDESIRPVSSQADSSAVPRDQVPRCRASPHIDNSFKCVTLDLVEPLPCGEREKVERLPGNTPPDAELPIQELITLSDIPIGGSETRRLEGDNEKLFPSLPRSEIIQGPGDEKKKRGYAPTLASVPSPLPGNELDDLRPANEHHLTRPRRESDDSRYSAASNTIHHVSLKDASSTSKDLRRLSTSGTGEPCTPGLAKQPGAKRQRKIRNIRLKDLERQISQVKKRLNFSSSKVQEFHIGTSGSDRGEKTPTPGSITGGRVFTPFCTKLIKPSSPANDS